MKPVFSKSSRRPKTAFSEKLLDIMSFKSFIENYYKIIDGNNRQTRIRLADFM